MDSTVQALEEVAQQLLSLGSILIIAAIAISIIPYILFGVGISGVAQRYGIRHTWYAWVPVARKHLLSEIADIRRQCARKPKRLEVQFEILACASAVCIYLACTTGNLIVLVILGILLVLLSYNQIFCYYYFYKLRDQENATIYFLLGMLVKPLNSFFVFHCR